MASQLPDRRLPGSGARPLRRRNQDSPRSPAGTGPWPADDALRGTSSTGATSGTGRYRLGWRGTLSVGSLEGASATAGDDSREPAYQQAGRDVVKLRQGRRLSGDVLHVGQRLQQVVGRARGSAGPVARSR